MPRPISATFDCAAFRANLATVRRHAGAARVWAVVKANAYGHGLARAAAALAEADGFALLDLDEAVRLRDLGMAKPILLLEGFFASQDLATLSALGLTAVVHSDEQVAMLASARVSRPIDVFLKLNTGMNRLGFAAERCADVFARLRDARAVGEVAFMTHFADADGPSGVAAQLERFHAATRGLPGLRSVANSAAILRFPDTRADWVRPGISLYGCSPFADESADDLGLRPVMTLASEVIGVQSLRAGERVGYGGTFVAHAPMRVGIVACGYADGYPRHAPSGTPIVVAGERTRTVGRVSMDMLVADLTSIPEAGVGSAVTLWGEGLSCDEVAAASGTVSYELLCALAARVPQRERT
ncbi:MAG: alanine racemase [Burkholderiales bacterium]|jgi:alanine racemase|nr:alanine racemase [Burkholderiales bacterium]